MRFSAKKNQGQDNYIDRFVLNRAASCIFLSVLIKFKLSLHKESIYFYKREDRWLKFVNFISRRGLIHSFVFGAGSF